MNPTQFWKNFQLGTELDIAGKFIYNGLRTLHEMETLNKEEEIFEFLYSVSVGMERLLKIAVVLIEHNEKMDQAQFEKSLITHTHQELLRRVKTKHKVNLGAQHAEFLTLLGKFYRTHRYARYAMASIWAVDEKVAFHKWLTKHLGIEINEPPLAFNPNTRQIKKFVGKVAGKFTTQLFEIITTEAHRLSLYTYELDQRSKAMKIFLRKEFDFLSEDVLWRELLVYLIKSPSKTGHFAIIDALKPLDFDPALVADYLQCFDAELRKLDVLEELDELYKGVKKPIGERLEHVLAIGDPTLYFDDEDDEDEAS